VSCFSVNRFPLTVDRFPLTDKKSEYMQTNFFKMYKRRVTTRVAPTLFIVHCSLFIILCPGALSAQTPLQVCAGQGYIIKSNAEAIGASPVTYTWYESTNGGAMTGISGSASSLSMPEGKAEPGTYTYVRMAANEECSDGVMSNTFTVVVHALPETPTIMASVSAVCLNTNVVFWVTSPVSGATYTWLGTAGTASTGTGNSYTVSGGATGTKSVSVYSHVTSGGVTCQSANASTVTATVSTCCNPSVSFPNTLCTACCYNGSAWIDCYVTTNAYPFDNTSINTPINWMGGGTYYYSGARSNKDGRANTAAITGATGESAVQLCKDLGEGWYLPAYEELYAMSAGAAYASSNNLAGANLLATPIGYYWSSTELYNNGGRTSGIAPAHQSNAVVVRYSGNMSYPSKSTTYYYVRCAWRE
jgi:hypothetical protein